MKSTIEVFIRTRPTNNFAHKNIKIEEDKGLIHVNIPKKEERDIVNHQQDSWSFKFDKILVNETQQTIFELTAQKAINSVVNGISSTVVAYGQTGAGKTFTVIGLNNDYRYRGLIPRSISEIFKQMTQKHDTQYKVLVSYIEVYNEVLHDLLHPNLSSNIILQEDDVYGVIPKGAAMVEVKSEEEALGLMFSGEVNRTICEHKLNKQSSRSHAIFSIVLEARSKFESSEKLIISKLNIVDLAGSERTKKTNSEGKTLLEASFINKSLSYLEQLVVACNNKNRDCLPYRQSKLTYLLKDSLGGNCKTIMIANIWPESDYLEETISTFRFASRMTQVVNNLEKKVQLDTKALIRKYERMIRDLKTELSMHDTLVGRGRITYESYTPEQQYQQQKLAQDFLDNKVEDIEIESIRQVKELFFQFKNIYRSLLLNSKKLSNEEIEEKVKKQMTNELEDSLKQDLVGQEEQGNFEYTRGFGIGQAAYDSKPKYVNTKQPIDQTKREEDKENQPVQITEKINLDEQSDDDISNMNGKLDKNQLFEHFKNNQGIRFVEKIKNILENIKESKEKFDSEKKQCSLLKQNIDELQIILKNKYPDESEIEELEGDDLNDVNNLRALKKKYKKHYEEYKYFKKNIKELENDLQNSKKECIDNFNDFLKNSYNITLDYFDHKDVIKNTPTSSQANMNSEEEIYEKALKKFETIKKARRMERLNLI